jgi:hypothetical protein
MNQRECGTYTEKKNSQLMRGLGFLALKRKKSERRRGPEKKSFFGFIINSE